MKKCVLPSVTFPFLLLLLLLFLRKESYMNIKAPTNSGHLQTRQKLVSLYRDISKYFFRNWGFLLFFLKRIKVKRSSFAWRFFSRFCLKLKFKEELFYFHRANRIFQIVSFKTVLGFCFSYLSGVSSNLIWWFSV